MHKVINDKPALDKFYRKLFFYKSFIFKKTTFTVETKYEQLKTNYQSFKYQKKKR